MSHFESLDSAKAWCIAKKRVVYKLHGGWFINRTPGEFINRGLFVKFEGLGSCGPGKLTEKGKFPKVLRGGRKRSFGPREQRSPKSLLHHPKPRFAPCKMGVLGGAKDFSETFAPWGSKRPLAPSPKHFWEFPFFGQCPRPAASQLKIFSVEILQRERERGKFNTRFLAARQFISPNLVTRIAATSNRKSLATAIATQKKNHCDSESTCETAISLRFLREKLATSKL